jgi:hypothetical protein
MKKYLFRGREIKTKKWVYGGFHEHQPSVAAIGKQPETEALIIADGNADWDLPIPIEAHVVEKETIGQYTGLIAEKSCRGAKPRDLMIFDGDIVLRVHAEISGIIEIKKYIIDFERGGFMISRIEPWPFFRMGTCLLHDDYRCHVEELEGHYEIIGNIYDMPELLKEANLE